MKKETVAFLLALSACSPDSQPYIRSSNNQLVRVEPSAEPGVYSLYDVSKEEATHIQNALPCHPDWIFYPDGNFTETYHLKIPPRRRESSDWYDIRKALKEEGLEAYRCSKSDHSRRF